MRAARSEDASAIEQIRAKGWQYAYRNILSDTFLAFKTSPQVIQQKIDSFAERLHNSSKCNDVFIVATNGLAVVGFVEGGTIQSAECRADKELHSLYIHPDYIGLGLGKMLMQAFAREMQLKGAQSFGLMCFTDNKSMSFYKKMGGKITIERPSGAKFEYKMGSFLEFDIATVLKK